MVVYNHYIMCKSVDCDVLQSHIWLNTPDHIYVTYHWYYMQERRHDPRRGMSLLVEDWVSRASALQRKGRAGRVRAGVCWGMYTRHHFEHRMRRYQVGLTLLYCYHTRRHSITVQSINLLHRLCRQLCCSARMATFLPGHVRVTGDTLMARLPCCLR